MSGEVRSWRLHARTTWTLDSLAAAINLIVRGWINYYGRFRPSQLYPLLTRINAYLMRWARKKYRRLRSYRRAKAWWQGLVQRAPALFAHWARTTAFWGASDSAHHDKEEKRPVKGDLHAGIRGRRRVQPLRRPDSSRGA